MGGDYGDEWSEAPPTGGDAWYQGTDASPPPEVDSDRHVTADFDLQLLGANPHDAAAAWPTLTDQEKASVTMAMTAVFGSAFAQAFLVTPTDLGIDRDTIRNIAPSQVEARGFQYARTEGNFYIYFQPSGRRFELEVFHDVDRGEDPEPVVNDADAGMLAEARGECEHLDVWYASLRELAAEARHRLRATDYPVAWCRVYQSMLSFGWAIQAATDRAANWRVSDASLVELEGYRARVNAYYQSWQSRALADETWDGLPTPQDSNGNFVDCDQILTNAGG